MDVDDAVFCTPLSRRNKELPVAAVPVGSRCFALDDLLKFTSVTGRMAKKVGKPSEL